LSEKRSNQGYTFTVEYNRLSRVLITPVEIEASKDTKDKIQINALWDTGASCSLIRPEVVRKLDLKPISKTFISTPSEENVPSNVYLVNLFLPNKTKIVDVQVTEGRPNSCDMLIGMDVITLGDFVISNYDKKTALSFRMPSLMKFDFCKDSYLKPLENDSKKVGRNEPCPCGSGKKYKHCCYGAKSFD
jgi:predicted aspartyl protease